MRTQALKLLAVGATLALALSPGVVFASGFQLVEQNGSGLGNAFSGQAAGVNDASAIYFNPALLTRLEGNNLVLSVEPIIPSYTFADGGSTTPSLPPLPGVPPLGIPLGGLGGDAGGLTPVPNGYVSFQAGENLWLGVGVNIPFGLTTEWEDDWMGRFHGVKSSIHAINVNPTVAVKLGALSLGAGINWQQFDAELTQNTAYGGAAFGTAFSLGGAPAAGAIAVQLATQGGLAAEGLTVLDGDSQAWGWNVGATLALGEDARLGVSYRSAIEHTLEGTIAFQNAPTFVAGNDPVGMIGAGLNAAFSDRPVTADIKLPDTLSVALAWEGESVEVLADWTWTGWSSIPSLDIMDDAGEVSSLTLQFEDTWRAGLGLNFLLNEAWKLRVGTAYDKSPVQDEYRTPRLPDTDRIWLAGGAQWKLNEKNSVDFGYAYLIMDDSPSELVANPQSPDYAEQLLQGNLTGTYQANVQILSLQYTLSF